MVGLWIRLGTSIAGDTALGIRLFAPLSVAVVTLLLADAADRMYPGREAGLRAAALLNATLLLGAGGVLMTPDAPLLAFWIASIWALARFLDSYNPYWWLAIGLFAGLAMASKYSAALLWIGIAIWLLVTPSMRPWLRRWEPWLGAALGLALFLPILLWDAEHGWTSFLRQGGRVVVWQPARALQFLAELIAGQMGLVTPLVFLLCVVGTFEAMRQAWRYRDPAPTLLVSLILPGVALFTQHALGDRVQGNWPSVIYPAAVVAAGALTAPLWRRLWKPAIELGFGLTFLVYIQGGLQLLPLPARLDPIARQLVGWGEFAAEVDSAQRRAGAVAIVVDQYGVAAELARMLPLDVPVIGAEGRWVYFSLPVARLAGKTVVLLSTGDRPLPWPGGTQIGTITRRSDGEAVQTFLLYRITVPNDVADAVVLPRIGD